MFYLNKYLIKFLKHFWKIIIMFSKKHLINNYYKNTFKNTSLKVLQSWSNGKLYIRILMMVHVTITIDCFRKHNFNLNNILRQLLVIIFYKIFFKIIVLFLSKSQERGHQYQNNVTHLYTIVSIIWTIS